MPVLPIPDDLGPQRLFSWLTAHMQFPDSPGTALYHFVRDLVGQELQEADPNEEVTLPVQWLRALALGPLVEKEKAPGIDRNKAGITAGLCLCFLFVMAKSGHPQPSLNKAIHVIETIGEWKAKQGISLEHYMNKKDIMRAWGLMKNVAHFWAGIELLQLTSVAAGAAPGHEAMGLYLRCVATLRQFACQYVPSHSKLKPLIADPEQTLALPDEFERNAIAFSDLSIPAWMLEILSEYRAPMHIS